MQLSGMGQSGLHLGVGQIIQFLIVMMEKLGTVLELQFFHSTELH